MDDRCPSICYAEHRMATLVFLMIVTFNQTLVYSETNKPFDDIIKSILCLICVWRVFMGLVVTV